MLQSQCQLWVAASWAPASHAHAPTGMHDVSSHQTSQTRLPYTSYLVNCLHSIPMDHCISGWWLYLPLMTGTWVFWEWLDLVLPWRLQLSYHTQQAQNHADFAPLTQIPACQETHREGCEICLIVVSKPIGNNKMERIHVRGIVSGKAQEWNTGSLPWS